MRRLFYLSALLALVGCGSATSKVAVHPVSGQVLYAGQPAAGVQVFLMPTSAPVVPAVPANPSAVTDQQGQFRLTTYAPGDGAAEGGYQVVLHWPSTGDREADTDRLLGWYSAIHSKLTAQIKPGDNTLPPIQLGAIARPPEPSQGVPGRN